MTPVRTAPITRAVHWDALFLVLAAVHGVLLITSPNVALIAVGLWWNANTISHNFIHRPFFRARWMNATFSAYLTLLLGIPQRIWRDRHLAHHANVEWRPHSSRQLVAELVLVATLWLVLATTSPWFFVATYLPGFVMGLTLCALQGHYEHAHATTSHYGRLYNALFFNDGYHVEHHASPGTHWTELPNGATPSARTSRWPPLLRWLDDLFAANRENFENLENPTNHANLANLANRANLANLCLLEHVVLRSEFLQRFVLHNHRRAIASLLSDRPLPQRIAVVGGALFPRTALILQELAPSAAIVIIDASRANIDTARTAVRDVHFVRQRYSADFSLHDFDLVVIPLAFDGDRDAIYRHPPAATVLVHDWIWRKRPGGRTVSMALLKCVNLVRQ